MSKRRSKEEPAPPSASVRVDKWLWATRSYKTRSMASAACAAGHVKVNNTVVRSSYKVKVGDNVKALTAGGRKVLTVLALSEKRASYSIARLLYEDLTPPPIKEIAPPRFERGGGRPTKKDRRSLNKLRGR